MTITMERTLDFSPDIRQRLEIFVRLLRKWNHKINLITTADNQIIGERHILDSARLKNAIVPDAGMLTDFGSGAGFPGLILAILGERNVHLIESDQRKIEFLREAARLTETKVTLHSARSEALKPWPSDIVTARAFAPLPRLLQLIYPFCMKDTSCYLLKGVSF